MGRRESKTGWERLRDREDREEEDRQAEREAEVLKSRQKPGGTTTSRVPGDDAGRGRSDATPEHLTELMNRIEPMLEQLHQLYSQYFSGVEKLPPVERRKQVDQALQSLMMAPKPTPMLQFRANTVQSRYRTYVDQWEKNFRDLESGKLKRRLISK